jgi:hypothetical protein
MPIDEEASEFASTEASAISSQFDSMRVMVPNGNKVYVIEGGKKRWIPNPSTYNNLFRSWSGIHVSMYVATIPTGRSIQNGAHLFKGSRPHTYIMDHGRKIHIVSPTVFNKYYF